MKINWQNPDWSHVAILSLSGGLVVMVGIDLYYKLKGF